MQRQKVKGTGHKQPTDISTEPNFYSMPKLEGDSEGETVALPVGSDIFFNNGTIDVKGEAPGVNTNTLKVTQTMNRPH